MRNSKRIKIVAGGTAALFGVGVAFAAWTSTGTGDGAVTATAAQDLLVEQVATVSGLYPTGSKDIQIKVTNQNDYPVTITSLVPGAVEVDAGHTDCTTHLVTFGGAPSFTQRVAGNASETFTFPVAMGADSDNDCQGATFTAEYTATSASSN